MSGPIIITTSTYNGPERRGKVMEHEEKRQTNEVAIARLEVNVEFLKDDVTYIKKAVDEIKAAKQSCTDCEAAIALREHIADHKTHANAKWDRTKYLITTAIAVMALAWAIFGKIPSSVAVTPQPTTTQRVLLDK